MGEIAHAMPATVARNLGMSDLGASLAAGWNDFRAYPAFGLVFGAIYVAVGWLIWFALARRGAVAWLIPVAGGFPLVMPFVAAGFYEVSRRREAGLPLRWRTVLGAMRGHGDDQLMMMGGFVFVGFTFWIIIAHTIFAVFMASSGIGAESLSIFATREGVAMLLFGGAVGAIIALTFYAVTVISLPLLVDREVDFLSAIIVSLAVVRANPVVLLAWAVLAAAALALAMAPLFLGLPVVLPVLGHATWHLYRRAVSVPAI